MPSNLKLDRAIRELATVSAETARAAAAARGDDWIAATVVEVSGDGTLIDVEFPGAVDEVGDPVTVFGLPRMAGPEVEAGDTVLVKRFGSTMLVMGKTGAGGGPSAGQLSYHHDQVLAAAVWTIPHNLGYKPGGVSARDSSGNNVIGVVDHIDVNTLTITYAAAFAGAADLS